MPKQVHVKSQELEVERRANEIALRVPAVGMERAFYRIANLPKELLDIRKKDKPQKREHKKSVLALEIQNWVGRR